MSTKTNKEIDIHAKSSKPKFKLSRKLSDIEKSYTKIKEEGIAFSRTLSERISSSGDTTGTPFYHFRWKRHFLADYIAYPKSDEDVIKIIQSANEYIVSVTPRGAGSCYYGSGSPTNGGVVVDMKRMKECQINKDNMTATVQTGICFSNLMDLLDEKDLELGCYPTSALTTTLGGWIGTGGTMGIGTVQNGPFLNQMVSMKVVSPTGNLKQYNEKDDFEQFFGSNGIFGIVTEVVLKIFPKSTKTDPIMAGFSSLGDLLKAIQVILSNTNPFVLRFSDKYHEYNCSGLTRHSHYMFLLYNGRNKDLDTDVKEALKLIEQNNGTFLGTKFSHDTWEDYLKHELKIKLETPVQMLQQIYIGFQKTELILNYFEKLIKKNKLNHCFYGLINRDNNVRLCLYTPTDNEYWMHFLSSKAVISKVVKYAYKLGGRIYTYGLQNTIYLHKFEKDKLKKFREKKAKVDPNYILNPLKIVKTKISFFRVNMMFELIMFYRRIATKLGLAKEILVLNI